MIVTKIMKLSDARSKVYIDEEFAFVLYKGELRIYGIEEGGEIEEDTYESIVHEILPKRAKMRSMNLLQKRDYTRQQLERKLELGGYPHMCIEEALAYVESYGYINDEKYTDDYIRYKLTSKSIKQIEMDLKKKGVDSNLIRDALSKIGRDESEKSEAEIIKKLLQKKHYNPESTTWEEKQKILAFLYRKGFDTWSVERVLKTYN